MITNSGTASYIFGTGFGVHALYQFTNTDLSLTNEGTIKAVNYGVAGKNTTTITNSGTGSKILSTNTGVLTFGTEIITNQGSIIGTKYYGIKSTGGGSITNSGTASLIQGGGIGIKAGYYTTITNAGTVTGAIDGVVIGSGMVTNTGTASLIHGDAVGVVFNSSSATVFNEGTISGGQFAAAGGIGIYLRSSGTITNSGAASLITAATTGVYARGALTLTNAGTISGGNTAVQMRNGVANRVIVAPGAVFVGKVDAGTGGNNTLELAAGASAGTITGFGTTFQHFNSIVLDTNAAWTVAGATSAFSGVTVSGFSVDDTLNFTNLAFDAGETAAPDGAGHLNILSSGGATLFSLNVSQTFAAGALFNLTSDGAGGTDLSFTNCFLRGTRIATPDGEVAIEDVRIGDHVVTRFGGVRQVKWVGRQRFAGRFLAEESDRWPVWIAAGALGGGLPDRDLVVSPEHALLIDEVLVPAALLLNGSTIRRVTGLDEIDYFNPEFDSHDCVMAHGVWAESFADTGNRLSFHNHAEYAALYPDDEPVRDAFCAPRAEWGDAGVAAVRARLGCADEGRYEEGAEIALLVDGRRVDAEWRDGAAHRFRLSVRDGGLPGALVLASRSDVPGRDHAGGDARRLGVAVAEMRVLGDGVRLEIGPDWAGFGPGFHGSEGTHRWSDGHGHLAASLLAGFAGEVTIEVIAHGLPRYRVPAEGWSRAA
ncbi:MAG: Hint domain-containing protein [Alphaproteobacteria bacterium]|nr:Hint domain-containing protein [Alphaproteobacteria bacterium]